MPSRSGIHYSGALAATVAVALSIVDAASPVRAQGSGAALTADCRAEQGMSYLCGFVRPEDVVNLGSTGLVLASGHSVPGHMYLIDPAAGTQQELLHGAAFRQAHDPEAFPGCPGPLNPQAVDVHGISVAELAPGRFELYTTSHGEREAIEIYELGLGGPAPTLTWTGCVMLQQDGYFNSVVRLADGGFIATRMRDASASNDDIAPGQITGRLFEWHPSGELEPLPGTELSLPNGIEVSADERYVYVTASGTNEVVRFDRRSTPMTQRAVAVPMRPDNLHWDGHGQLLSAGRNPVDPACRGSACAAGWSAIVIDPDTLEFTVLGRVDGTAAMQRASAAIRVGDEIWVGSNEDRIARFPLN